MLNNLKGGKLHLQEAAESHFQAVGWKLKSPEQRSLTTALSG
jgi:hypothetical protein